MMGKTFDHASVVLRTEQHEDYGLVNQIAQPSFSAVFDRIAPAAGKFMATLFNTSSERVAVVQRVRVYNWQVGVAIGSFLEQELRRITARIAGASVPVVPADSAVPVSVGITADTGSTVVTEDALLKRLFASNVQVVLGDVVGLANGLTVYERRSGERGIALRADEGISIKNVTVSVIGTVSYVVEFTDEPA
jgi:hypothetical protein